MQLSCGQLYGGNVYEKYAPIHTQQTRGIHPILFQCWSTVFDADPTLKQHRVNSSCCWAGSSSPGARYRQSVPQGGNLPTVMTVVSRPTKPQITPQVGLSPTDPTSGFWNSRYVNISVKVSHNYHLTVITLSSNFWLEKRLSHSIARLFTELSKIDTATSLVITWSAHDTCMLYCWLIMPRNLWVTLENCWMTILHFKVVLAAIFIKININNR